MINGLQCRAARALIELTREQLAQLSGLGLDLISRFEQKEAQPTSAEITTLQSVLEEHGAVFIQDGETVSEEGGAGVRLNATKSDAKQINRMESEGGPVA